MNKLLVSDVIKLNNGEYYLDVSSNTLDLIIEGVVKAYLVNSPLNKLIVNMSNDAKLDLYVFNEYTEKDVTVIINQNNNSKVYYNESFKNKKDNKLQIFNYIKGNDNESNINIRNICDNDNSNIIINVEIDNDTFNNVALEDLKGINNGGHIHIEPNIICKSHDVSANHLTTIGSLDKNSVDYLMSKGIDKENTKKLLLKGFQFSNMDEYIKCEFGGE